MRTGRRLLFAVVLAGGLAAWLPAGAWDFSCQGEGCPNQAQCSGDAYEQNGCSLQCYHLDGQTHQLTKAGSAGCSGEPIEDGGY